MEYVFVYHERQDGNETMIAKKMKFPAKQTYDKILLKIVKIFIMKFIGLEY